LSLGLFGIRADYQSSGIDWTMIMAGNVLMTLPVVLLFILFQKYFVQGMTMSGLKG
jgi:multiple sugar transport system permease protein